MKDHLGEKRCLGSESAGNPTINPVEKIHQTDFMGQWGRPGRIGIGMKLFISMGSRCHKNVDRRAVIGIQTG
jgi:hypothetical protein